MKLFTGPEISASVVVKGYVLFSGQIFTNESEQSSSTNESEQSSSTNESEQSNSNTGLIVGAAVGGVVLIIVNVVVVVIVCVR